VLLPYSASALQKPTSVLAGARPLRRSCLDQEGFHVSAELYDPSAGTFTSTGNMIVGARVRSTLLPDGRVLVTGCAAQCSVGTTELYDFRTGMFSATGRGGLGTVGAAAVQLSAKRTMRWPGIFLASSTTLFWSWARFAPFARYSQSPRRWSQSFLVSLPQIFFCISVGRGRSRMAVCMAPSVCT